MLQATWLPNLPAVPAVRLVTGLAQGVALCLLYSAAENGYWPATHGLVFAPLLLVACFVPIIVLDGVGNMRPRSLLIWAVAAAAVLAGLAVHDIARGADGGNGSVWGLLLNHRDDLAIWPSPLLLFFSAVGLFIGHALVVACGSERRIIARGRSASAVDPTLRRRRAGAPEPLSTTGHARPIDRGWAGAEPRCLPAGRTLPASFVSSTGPRGSRSA